MNFPAPVSKGFAKASKRYCKNFAKKRRKDLKQSGNRALRRAIKIAINREDYDFVNLPHFRVSDARDF